MELLCALLSLHIHKKKNNTYPGRLNQFIFQENIYSRLNDQNANKMKNIGKRSKDADQNEIDSIRESMYQTCLDQTSEVSMSKIIVQNRLSKQVCLSELTRIEDQRKARDEDYYDWTNMAPFCSLLSRHILEKKKTHTPDAKTKFSARKSYSRLNYQNVWKKKDIEEKTPLDAKSIFCRKRKHWDKLKNAQKKKDICPVG